MQLCVLNTPTGSTTLKLDDLLAPLASSGALTALKKSTKVLTSTSRKINTLSAPLPQRAQERLDREAAYEQTKEEVDKWSATMKLIKQVPFLSSPTNIFVINSRWMVGRAFELSVTSTVGRSCLQLGASSKIQGWFHFLFNLR